MAEKRRSNGAKSDSDDAGDNVTSIERMARDREERLEPFGQFAVHGVEPQLTMTVDAHYEGRDPTLMASAKLKAYDHGVAGQWQMGDRVRFVVEGVVTGVTFREMRDGDVVIGIDRVHSVELDGMADADD
jgi:hypothetical protein